MSQICGSCGDTLRVKETCVGASLCFPCARDFLGILFDMGLMTNPIAVDLAMMCGQRVDSFSQHGFMIWGLGSAKRGYPWHYVDDSELIYLTDGS